ncbi:MAG: toprim domain-containing protein, partial [Planctomycetota bacterium]|nr:toprim domain-containing protein [Planctomycetota bacterium]
MNGESPTNARANYPIRPPGVTVEASVGHVRDLPTSAAEVPAAIKKEPWGRMCINVDSEFEPTYVVPSSKKKQVAKLRKLLKDADVLYLATDEDREG